jgi:AcrR family transcriptional regulator
MYSAVHMASQSHPGEGVDDLCGPLPRGQHALPPDVVAGAQRARLLDAVLRTVGEKGYLATTVADVIARAGVSRSTFYEHFDDKQHCFLAAYDRAADRQFESVVTASTKVSDQPFDRFRAGVRGYLAGLAEEPEYARSFLVEVLAAGPEGRERRRRVQRRYADLASAWHGDLRRARPDIPRLPADVFAAAVAAGQELVAQHFRDHGASHLPKLEKLIVYSYMALLGLRDEARASFA